MENGIVKVLTTHYSQSINLNKNLKKMNTLSIQGTLIQKNNIENIENKEGKKWLKQTFLIQTNAEYNNKICFQLFGEEKVKLLDNHKKGDNIEVFFNISSREYNNRYYHNIDAWKINPTDAISNPENVTNSQEANEEEILPF